MALALPILLFITVFAGALLLTLGLRGRRLNNHPACATCTFDLSGLASPTRCPECGQDLSKPKAIRAGIRTRRPRLAIAGAALLLFALLGTISGVAVFLGGPKAHKVTPTRILLLEAHLRTDAGLADVLSELLDRDMNGLLSPSQRASLVSLAFRLQQNPRLNFPRAAAAILDDPTIRSLLPKADQSTALTSGAYPELTIRPRIRAGSPLPVRLGLGVNGRFIRPGVRSAGISPMQVRVTDAAGRVVAEIKHPIVGMLQTFAPAPSNVPSQQISNRSVASYLLSVPHDLPPGTYTLTLNATLYLTNRARQFPFTPSADDIPLPVSQTTTLEVVPPESSTVRLVNDEPTRALLNSTLKLTMLPSHYSATQTWIYVGMSVTYGRGGWPTNPTLPEGQSSLAGVYRVFATRLNADGSEDARSVIPLGQCLLRFNGAWSFQPPGAAIDNPAPKGTYRLIFAPDPVYAESQIEYDAILDGRLIFDGIELK